MKRPMLLLLLAVLLCFALGRSLFPDKMLERFQVLDNLSGQNETVKGKVEGQVAKAELQEKGQRLLLKDVTILAGGAKTHAEALILYTKDNRSCIPGDFLQGEGVVQEWEEAENPGQFSTKEYYLSQNIYYKCIADEIVIKHTKSWFWRGIAVCKNRLSKVYDSHLPEKEAGIMKAMLLGEKTGLLEEIQELYEKAGMSHILSISGMHISILAMCLFGLLKALHLPEPPAVAITLFFLYSYLLMTGQGVATKRAVLMMSLFFVAKLVHRTYDLLSAWAFSAVVILVQTPFVLFQSGFLLSFGAVLGICVLCPAFEGVFGMTEEQRQHRRELHRRQKEWRANHKGICYEEWKEKLWDYVKKLFLASMSIQLMLLPILAGFYYEIPTYSIMLNLLILPFVSILLLVGIAGGIAGSIWLPLGGLLRFPIGGILSWYEQAARFFLNLPGSRLITGKPELWKVLVYYGGLLLFVLLASKKRVGPQKIFLNLIWILSLCLLLFPEKNTGVEITFLSVGQGDGIVIRSETGTVYLLDGGSSSVSEVEKYRITPFLLSKRMPVIDYAILSHPDADHCNGLADLLEKSDDGGVRIKRLVLPLLSFADEDCEQLANLAKSHGVEVSYMQKGDRLVDGDLEFQCLHPTEGFVTEDKNAYSLTLAMHYEDTAVLFTGDLPAEEEAGVRQAWQEWRNNFPSIECTILKVGHHGSKHSTAVETIKCLTPQLAVISSGRNNRYGHPHEELLERLEDGRCLIYNTQDEGAVTVEIQKGEARVEGFLR